MPRTVAALRGGSSDPARERLTAAVEALAVEHARLHGWSQNGLGDASKRMRRGLRLLLAHQDVPGAVIKASEVTPLTRIGVPAGPIMAVLAEAGLLDDDRTPRLVRRFERQSAGLPEPMLGELRTWFNIARLGSPIPPRSLPQAEETIRLALDAAEPVLKDWARRVDSLREITRQDVLTAIADHPCRGSGRTLQSLRRIFRTLKAHKTVFTDPTSRIRSDMAFPRTPMPLDLAKLLDAVHSPVPARAALASLLAFHALEPAQVRNLQRAALVDGRLHLDGRVILLAPQVEQRLHAYLDVRDRRWPLTANPHLFITQFTARRISPVTSAWVNKTLGMTAQSIREDRILDEARDSCGDVRRLCALFGVSVGTALRYTATLGHPGLTEVNIHLRRPPQ